MAVRDLAHRDVLSSSQIFFGMRLPLLLQRQKSRAAVEKLLSWKPEGIILSHGRCFESDGSGILRRLFGWLL